MAFIKTNHHTFSIWYFWLWHSELWGDQKLNPPSLSSSLFSAGRFPVSIRLQQLAPSLHHSRDYRQTVWARCLPRASPIWSPLPPSHFELFLCLNRSCKRLVLYDRKGENCMWCLLSASYKFSWHLAPESRCPTILHNKSAAKKRQKGRKINRSMAFSGSQHSLAGFLLAHLQLVGEALCGWTLCWIKSAQQHLLSQSLWLKWK